MLAGAVALLAAALFTGAALYISLVAQPARLALDDALLLAEWRVSSVRASFLLAALALIGFGLGIIAGQRDGGLWFVGGIVLFAHWPYTFLWMAPRARQIAAYVPNQGKAELHLLVRAWGRFHAVRTALGALASLIFVSALA